LTKRQREYAQFTGTIQTDGVAICIHYRRPLLPGVEPQGKKKKKKKADVVEFKREKNDRVIGVDPGRACLFTGVEILPGNKRKVYKLSRPRYYLECGFTLANKRKDNWNKGIQSSLNDMSEHSTKGTSMKTFLGYLGAVLHHYDSLWGEYLKRRWGRQRFATYSGKQSTVHRFLKSLDDGSGRRTVLAYGDAGFSSNGPGELSVPTSGLVKACAKKYKVAMIDEFRTSQIHHQDDVRMSYVSQNGFKVRGLLWCSSTRGSKFVDRDINAALNILRCYNGGENRPVALRRQTPKQPVPTTKVLPKKPGAVAVKRKRRDLGKDADIRYWYPSLYNLDVSTVTNTVFQTTLV